MCPISDLIDKEIGAPVRPVVNPLVAAVGAAAVQVLPNNPNRLGFIIVNLSANLVYFMIDNAVGAARGIVLAPGGGWRSFIWNEDYYLCSWEWWGIAPAGASAILIISLEEV